MKLKQLTLKQSLNKAYRLIKPERAEIEKFKANFKLLLGHINPQESEENLKGHVMDFLKNTYYNPTYHIATKGRTDFVIHTGKDASHAAGVLFEAKKPSNSEMVTVSDLNRKAMHEIILYYLRERIEHHNNDIKYIAITNIYEWFVFDAPEFERLFFKNGSLVKEYKAWAAGQKVSTNNDLFYNEIAKPFIASLTEEIEFTWFDIREFEKPLKNGDKNDDNKLIPLFKVLSPTHLLKLPFSNDSNSLDKGFYNELLYLIGLEEVKEGNKKIIRRKQAGKRNDGSLIENTIVQLETENCIHKVTDSYSYGETTEEQIFSVALELCITWINRILFLKLLEAQLLKYHKGDKSYKFLNYSTINQYDELYKLFFLVLAKKQNERHDKVKAKYSHIPYLNSSLFDRTVLEEQTIRINMLDDDAEMLLLDRTVLKDDKGKPVAAKLNSLQYLFEFLNAYDFASEGSEEIQEERKTLINAAVLGLIFEKINGYKDGSIYTPGFITMYMCRQSIRQAVVNKFKEKYNWKAETFEDLHNYISDDRSANRILEYNNLINSLTICDPAVGSGHFLVSALNELIAIKSELGILADAKGKRLTDYVATVENDELIVTDRERNFFTYSVTTNHNQITIPNAEVQRAQETLFHEKQNLIENCLFGVDINPKSVQICRLRLWIELLKNAYYITEGNTSNGDLQTLPNIDINIKSGNSLLSRFELQDEVFKNVPNFKKKLNDYKFWVYEYKNSKDRALKNQLTENIRVFVDEFKKRDPKVVVLQKELDKKSASFYERFVAQKLFAETDSRKVLKEKEALELAITKIRNEIDRLNESRIYSNAFEWRFEFPEVLDEEGNFKGFDLVIANPPYIRQEELSDLKNHFQERYKVYSPGGDIFSYFYELGHNILKEGGTFSFINNTFDKTTAGKVLREFVVKNFEISRYLDFTSVIVFEEATTYPAILIAEKQQKKSAFKFIKLDKDNFKNLEVMFDETSYSLIPQASLNPNAWNFLNTGETALLQKIQKYRPLREIYGKCYYGVKTALNDAFVTNKDLGKSVVLKPVYDGKDLKKWLAPTPTKEMIVFESKSTKKKFGDLSEDEALQKMQEEYDEIFKHLMPFETAAKSRYDKGDYWWELRNCAYYDLFNKAKIVFPNLQNTNKFAFDEDGIYLNAPAVFLPTNDKYLLAVLNSKVVWHFLTSICVVRSGGFIEVKPQYFEQIPIPEIPEEEKQPFITTTDKILSMKKDNSKADTSELENEIDRLVFRLYSLTEDEIKLIQNDKK